MPPVKKPISLDDLSDEDRARLLAEARSVPPEPETVNAEVLARQDAVKALMDERDHARGCPEPASRIEFYGHTRPAKPNDGIAARSVTVVHCQECGGTTVLEQGVDVTTAAILESVNRAVQTTA